MRIYYVGESRSRNLSVATALGVDGEHWDAASEHVLDWRWVMEDEFNVPTGRTLRGADLLSPRGSLPKGLRRRFTTLEGGLEIMMTSLRVLEHSMNNRGGVSVINVCRRNSPFRQHRRRGRAAARERLLELVNASLAEDRRYAFFVEDEAKREDLPVLAAGPVHRDPILAACPYVGHGDSGKHVARDAAVYAAPLFSPIRRPLNLPVHLLCRDSVGFGRSSLAALLCGVSPVAGDVEFQDDGVVHHPVDGRGGGHGVGEDAFPLREDQVGRDAQGPAFVAFGDQGEEDLGLLVALGQVAQIVQEQEVEVVQLAQLSGQVEVALGGQKILHQAVGRYEEYGAAGFHQAVSQGAERVGLAGAGEPEGQHIDAVVHEAAVGQMVQLLP